MAEDNYLGFHHTVDERDSSFREEHIDYTPDRSYSISLITKKGYPSPQCQQTIAERGPTRDFGVAIGGLIQLLLDHGKNLDFSQLDLKITGLTERESWTTQTIIDWYTKTHSPESVDRVAEEVRRINPRGSGERRSKF